MEGFSFQEIVQVLKQLGFTPKLVSYTVIGLIAWYMIIQTIKVLKSKGNGDGN